MYSDDMFETQRSTSCLSHIGKTNQVLVETRQRDPSQMANPEVEQAPQQRRHRHKPTARSRQ